ncbi:MAG TPA: fibronectin type III domain-containing protein [Terriglobia bacterium]|jgi:hypothetical protein
MTNKIHLLLNTHQPDTGIATDAVAAYDGLNGNPNFVNPPVPLASFKAEIDSYASKIAAAGGGGKQAIIDRNAQRETVTMMMYQLGHWVVANCKDDLSIFQSSGFQARSTTRTPPAALPQPMIEKLENGDVSGQIRAKVKAIPKAINYEAQYASIGADGKPGSWTVLPPFTSSRSFLVTGLTPGTTYAFQVRALGRLGYTNWSDSAHRMSL